MKIVIAMDSFKGSLSSLEASHAVSCGIQKAGIEATILSYPIADGGEGTTKALVSGLNGTMQHLTVTGPLGEPVTAYYGILPDQTVVLEMASCTGLPLVPSTLRNPLHTTTYGVGEMIKDAISKGYRHFILGIGGSSTNDGGVGMLQALGYDFLDANHAPIPFGAIGLSQLHHIDDCHVLPELKDCTFRVACDVNNPLCGPQGCSQIFAPQKGGTPETIALMDSWLKHYADLSKQLYPESDPTLAGAGAAGGLGFALAYYLKASLTSGVLLILDALHLEQALSACDLVITGEGCLDGQSLMGKAPIGVAKLAKKYAKPVIAFSGSVTPDASLCHQFGIDAFFPILRKPDALDTLLDPAVASSNLTAASEEVFRLLQLQLLR